MKFLNRSSSPSRSRAASIGDILLVGAAGGALLAIWREARLTHATLEKVLLQQQRGEERVQATCENLLSVVVRLEQKVVASETPPAETVARMQKVPARKSPARTEKAGKAAPSRAGRPRKAQESDNARAGVTKAPKRQGEEGEA